MGHHYSFLSRLPGGFPALTLQVLSWGPAETFKRVSSGVAAHRAGHLVNEDHPPQYLSWRLGCTPSGEGDLLMGPMVLPS